MATPTKKAPALDALCDALLPSGSKGRSQSIRQNVCALCGKPAEEFRDALSRREYTISGMCQVCQDEVFAPPPEEDGEEEPATPHIEQDPILGPVETFELTQVFPAEEDADTKCEACKAPFTYKDIDGGRCLSCGSVIT